jgi:hypothetical protein
MIFDINSKAVVAAWYQVLLIRLKGVEVLVLAVNRLVAELSKIPLFGGLSK